LALKDARGLKFAKELIRGAGLSAKELRGKFNGQKPVPDDGQDDITFRHARSISTEGRDFLFFALKGRLGPKSHQS
jgi:hypothetical protein